MKAVLFFTSFASTLNGSVILTEFHYDNDGGDVGEFVEVYVNTTVSIADVEVLLYNGANGEILLRETVDDFVNSMATATLDGVDYDIYTWSPSSIQNGSPDGIAVTSGGNLVEFISYEGTFTAIEGPAMGVLSTDIGVSQNGSTPVGSSLSLTDNGWVSNNGTNSFGAANLNFTTVPEPSAVLLGALALMTVLRRRR